jgi:hypothetical protein
MNTDSRKLIEEMKLILRDKTPSLTVESLVFGEGNDPMSAVDQLPPKADLGEPSRRPTATDMTPYQSAEDEKVAHNVSPIDAEIKPLIDQIRVLALKGVAKLANNPTSESYQLLKKIWQTVDKAAESANKPQNNTQNNI